MKKCWLFVLLLFSVGLQAQGLFQADRFMPWKDTALQRALEHHIYSRPVPLEKPWQAALFMGAGLRPTQETLQALQSQMQQGNLVRAAVISFGQDNTPTLYVLSADNPAAIEQTALPQTMPAAALFERLLQELSADPSLYTALLINARSRDGLIIRYADEQIFVLSDILRPLQHTQLYIDVLDLQVCHLGNAFTTYQLARSGRVHYVMLSSERRRGSKTQFYYRLLLNLHLPPQEAALAASQDFVNTFDFTQDKSTHNLLVLDVSRLKTPFDSWLHTKPSLSLSSGRHSFPNVLSTTHTPAALQLQKALEQATLSQWCYSAAGHQLYLDTIPAGTDCVNGISISREIWNNPTLFF